MRNPFSKKQYRPNVAVIVTDGQGRVLLCERYDKPGQIQTVQGGVDDGESLGDAMKRELMEELGISEDQYTVVGQTKETYTYDWTSEFRDERKKQKHSVSYVGQEQTFFLVQVDPDVQFDLDVHHREFREVWWGQPQELAQRIWHPKRPGIEAALKEFGLM